MAGASGGVAGGDGDIPAETLLSIANDATHAIDRPALKSLVRAGALQPGRQVLVRGQPGSRTMYPAAAAAQLLLVLSLREQERPFDLLRCMVWWHGGWVAHTLLRQSILRRLDSAGLAEARRLTQMFPDPTDATDYLIDRLRDPPSRNPEPYPPGSTTTITTDHTAASTTKHQYNASPRSWLNNVPRKWFASSNGISATAATPTTEHLQLEESLMRSLSNAIREITRRP